MYNCDYGRGECYSQCEDCPPKRKGGDCRYDDCEPDDDMYFVRTVDCDAET